ncbi:MAG: DHH family phosphoesterase, partial [Candidatus Methanomethylophilaceae archaeon]
LLNGDGAYRGLPIIAFADSDDGVKVSARAEKGMAERGLNLSEIMKKASSMVGGFGGGHNVAAGATIPGDKKEEFLEIVEDLVSAQVI